MSRCHTTSRPGKTDRKSGGDNVHSKPSRCEVHGCRRTCLDFYGANPNVLRSGSHSRAPGLHAQPECAPSARFAPRSSRTLVPETLLLTIHGFLRVDRLPCSLAHLQRPGLSASEQKFHPFPSHTHFPSFSMSRSTASRIACAGERSSLSAPVGAAGFQGERTLRSLV